MKDHEIDLFLKSLIEDGRLNRSEGRSIKDILDPAHPNSADPHAVRRRAFALARTRIAEDSSRAAETLDWLDEFTRNFISSVEPSAPPTPSRAAFTPGGDPGALLRGLLSGAKRTIDICVFTITDNRISDAIRAAFERGVKIRIISDDEKSFDRGSDIERLSQAGIPVRTDSDPGHMHHKFAIFDESILATGSYNWTRGAAEMNSENLLVIGDPSLIKSYTDEFNRLWTAFATKETAPLI